ncbi:MAG: site-specific integrase [Leptolyngbya sp. SIO3F4]|nr:site-specific integrase [Leptolyngbya sp. SIO3F4]
MSPKSFPPTSKHITLTGHLIVNWEEDYHQDFRCIHCNSNDLFFLRQTRYLKTGGRLLCRACGKKIPLADKLNFNPDGPPQFSYHETLNGILEIDWRKEYRGEYSCLKCGSNQQYFVRSEKYREKLNLECKDCKKNSVLSCLLTWRKEPSITYHPTLNGKLEVNWDRDYHQDFRCVKCNSSDLFFSNYNVRKSTISGRIVCKKCNKQTALSCQNTKFSSGSPQLSFHKTLHGKLTVNWRIEYHGEYPCLKCRSKQNYLSKNDNFSEKLSFRCKKCGSFTSLSKRLSPHIYNFLPNVSCPNSGCTKLGPDGKTKGWVYRYKGGVKPRLKCHLCNIQFTENKENNPKSWTYNDGVKEFKFEEDSWDLRKFQEGTRQLTANFNFGPSWYKEQVKQYVYFLLNSGYASGTVIGYIGTFRAFSHIIQTYHLKEIKDITREVIRQYIDSQISIASKTLRTHLTFLRNFFEWLGLDSDVLIRKRDYPKVNFSDPDWLDETTRNAIQKHLFRIPDPIARQYQIQSYTAARPIDACRIKIDCLVEENGQWYIQFYQHRIKRMHRVPASREIRRLIEAQQIWIRQKLGNEYDYLFCHFRYVGPLGYQNGFSSMQALAKPPTPAAHSNPMVKVIRLLIENEDIRDSNGKQPNFTGRITRPSKLQEIRAKHGLEAAQLYADHSKPQVTFKHYAPPTQEQLAEVDLPFQELLLNLENRFLPWQSLPESLLKNPKAHELDMEIAPRLVVYGHCAQDPKVPCPENLFPKCYGCSSFRPSTEKLPLYERQYQGEKQRLDDAQVAGAELASEEASTTIEAMDKWLPELREIANGKS